jgi:hypothetical protein
MVSLISTRLLLSPFRGLTATLRIPSRGMRGIESSASNAGVPAIPSQLKVTKQILLHWQPFRDLKLKYVGSRQAEQLNLRSQQRIVATVEESVLKTEMSGLESQEEDAPKRILFFKPMSWLGQIRPHRQDESWSASLWQTFFSTSMGVQIPNDCGEASCGLWLSEVWDRHTGRSSLYLYRSLGCQKGSRLGG